MPLDYFVWLIRNDTRCVLVDTGFDADAARVRNRVLLASPAELLQLLGVGAEEILDIVITHMHYDHAGNSALFPNARYHLQDREMAFATGRHMCHQSLRQPFSGDDVAEMVRKVYAGRVVFHDGRSELFPGIILHRLGGHTDGLQVVQVWTRKGWMVLASDAAHFYANIESGRSFPIVYNVGEMYEGHRRCYALASEPGNVIPGHDPEVTRRFPAPSPELAGRIMRLD